MTYFETCGHISLCNTWLNITYHVILGKVQLYVQNMSRDNNSVVWYIITLNRWKKPINVEPNWREILIKRAIMLTGSNDMLLFNHTRYIDAMFQHNFQYTST